MVYGLCVCVCVLTPTNTTILEYSGDSYFLQADVAVQMEHRMMPEGCPNGLRNRGQALSHQIAYIVERAIDVKNEDEGYATYRLPVVSRSGLSSPSLRLLKSVSIGAAE